MQSLTFLQLYKYCKCKSNYASASVLQADMHRQVHVHAGIPYQVCRRSEHHAVLIGCQHQGCSHYSLGQGTGATLTL